jgi:hypothetical protein
MINRRRETENQAKRIKGTEMPYGGVRLGPTRRLAAERPDCEIAKTARAAR